MHRVATAMGVVKRALLMPARYAHLDVQRAVDATPQLSLVRPLPRRRSWRDDSRS